MIEDRDFGPTPQGISRHRATDDAKNAVRERFSFATYLRQAYPHAKFVADGPGWVKVAGESLGHLSFNDKEHCFTWGQRGISGDCFVLVGHMENLTTFPDQLQRCADLAGVYLEQDRAPMDHAKRGAAPAPEATWTYYDHDARPAYQVCRGVDERGKKTYWQRRADGSGGWVNGMKGVDRQLYNLEAVIEAAAQGKRVFIVEGEKCADALSKLGYTATTITGGAKATIAWEERYSEDLADAHVVIIPDNDDVGRAFAEQIAAHVHKVAASVRIVPLYPYGNDKRDVFDWLEEGNAPGALEALVRESDVWTPAGQFVIFTPRRDNRPPDEPPLIMVDNDGPLLTTGAIATIVAGPGVGKSAVMESIIASSSNHDADTLGLSVPAGTRILYVDLERTQRETWDSWDRACRRAHIESTPEFIAWRLYSTIPTVQQRLEQFKRDVEEHRPQLVLVDDIGDLVREPNDGSECTDLVFALGAHAKTAGFGILATLHPNPGPAGTTKPRGHLGSALYRRGQSMLEIHKRDDEIRLITTAGLYGKRRHGPPVTIAFVWDEMLGRFSSCPVPVAERKVGRKSTDGEIFALIFAEHASLTRAELGAAVTAARSERGQSIAAGTIREAISRAMRKGIITEHPDGSVTLAGQMPF